MTNEEEIAKTCYEQFMKDCYSGMVAVLDWEELPLLVRQGWINVVVRLGVFFSAIAVGNSLEPESRLSPLPESLTHPVEGGQYYHPEEPRL